MTVNPPRAVLIAGAAFIILGLSTTTVSSQEKMGDSRVQVTVKTEVARHDDVEGHTITLFESKGYNLKTGSWTVNRGTSDVIKGNGASQGYTKTHYPDGAVTFTRWEGEATTTMVDGKPVTSSAGAWLLMSGTGEWQNREAGGTWRAKAVGDGVTFVEWAGEWRSKK